MVRCTENTVDKAKKNDHRDDREDDYCRGKSSRLVGRRATVPLTRLHIVSADMASTMTMGGEGRGEADLSTATARISNVNQTGLER